ncbi:hypothetical protein [Chryseobacterium wanjuense]
MNTKLIILFGFFYFSFFRAQVPDDPMTITEYPAFYTQTVSKLNNLIPIKTTYYGQPLSTFLQALSQNNIIIKEYEPESFNNKYLQLSFVWNRDIRIGRYEHNYVEPHISIYFQQPYDYPQATVILNNSYHSHWNTTAENFIRI